MTTSPSQGFDPAEFLLVPPRTFEDLSVGEVFRAPSRTLTDAHTSEFQAVSADNHPRHYNDLYAQAHGLKAALVHPIQVLAFAAPGASLFTHYVGEVLLALVSSAATYHADSFVGDTLYTSLTIADLQTRDGKGIVRTDIEIMNQDGNTVLTGHHIFELKLSDPAPAQTRS